MNKHSELLIILTIVIFLLGLGYLWGYGAGMNKMRQIQDQVDCEVTYGSKTLSEVPVGCLKYFDLKDLKK
jgi:hypothetical protein